MTVLGKTFTQADARRVIWTALQAGFATGVLTTIVDVKTAKAAVVVFGGAALAAALSAVKNWWLADSSPVK